MRVLTTILATACLCAAAAAAQAVELGPLPPGAVSESHMGPADEFIVHIVFDPAPFRSSLADGTAFNRLDQVAKFDADVAAYVKAHPDRSGWAWSFFEVIGLQDMDYDGVKARLGREGGMAVWYASLRRLDRSDPRPKGYNDLALGTWLSDPALVAHMRGRGYPVEAARIVFRRKASRAYGLLQAGSLRVEARCRLQGHPFTPDWAKAPFSYETVWTPRPVGPSFEVLSWGGHQALECAHPEWRVSGSHPLARAFNARPLSGLGVSGSEFAIGYVVHGSLYRGP
jgi:hypothetical protein